MLAAIVLVNSLNRPYNYSCHVTLLIYCVVTVHERVAIIA